MDKNVWEYHIISRFLLENLKNLRRNSDVLYKKLYFLVFEIKTINIITVKLAAENNSVSLNKYGWLK